tara:strand:- start:256 stop:639 length:384 start_codon:yes stop_codon:yes gene_type:complete
MRLTKNFTKREFKSKDGSKMPIEVLENVRELALNLQELRDFLGEPLRINSAYRSEAHNQAVGGSSRSQHLLGKASDLRVKELDSEDLYHIIEALISEGKMKEGGLGLYNSFVHYDIRGTKARWNFKK